jgi:hypothetical protein
MLVVLAILLMLVPLIVLLATDRAARSVWGRGRTPTL